MSNTQVNLSRITCFAAHKKHKVNCHKQSCRYWIDSHENSCCAINLANSGPITLKDIGKFFGNLTRMRICQLETKAISKIKKILQAN